MRAKTRTRQPVPAFRRHAPLTALAAPAALLGSPATAFAADPATMAAASSGLLAPLAFGLAGLWLGRRIERRRGLRASAVDGGGAGGPELDAPRPVAADEPGLILHQHERDVLESLNEVIFRTDVEGRLRFLNSAWQRVSGYEVEQSLGQRLSEFLHPDDRETARAHLEAVLAARLPSCNCELRLQTRDGEVRWIAVAGHRIVEGEPGLGGIAGTLEDISTRKVAELTLKNLNHELESRVRARTAELEASNRELEAFSYSVSHDLRAPLRAIDGFTRILEEDLAGRLDDTERRHFARIRKGCERMAELIDALIDLARVTRQPLHKESFDFSELAAQVIEELRAEEPARAVDVEITDGLIVTADRQLARVLIENLLRNAWKFSARQPLARIAFRADREDDRRVFCVEDNGAGFDMAYATNLFRPFHRMHSQEDFPGTGIGLATVQRIIQRHEGTIRIESSPGKGTAVHFSLGN